MRARAEASRANGATGSATPVLNLENDEAIGPATPIRARAEASSVGGATGPANPRAHERATADRAGGANGPVTPMRARVEAHDVRVSASERDTLPHASGAASSIEVGAESARADAAATPEQADETLHTHSVANAAKRRRGPQLSPSARKRAAKHARDNAEE